MSAAATTAGPWTRRDGGFFAALILSGVVLVGVAWIGSSHELRLQDNDRWLAVAVLGLLIANAGNAWWFVRGRRAVVAQRRAVLNLQGVVAGFGEPNGVGGASGEAEVLVAVPGMRRFHRPGCRLVADKPGMSDTRADHEAVGRLACGMCRP